MRLDSSPQPKNPKPQFKVKWDAAIPAAWRRWLLPVAIAAAVATATVAGVLFDRKRQLEKMEYVYDRLEMIEQRLADPNIDKSGYDALKGLLEEVSDSAVTMPGRWVSQQDMFAAIDDTKKKLEAHPLGGGTGIIPIAGALADAQAAYNTKDYAKAFAIYLDLANKGDASALGWVALMTQQGQGVTADLPKAIEWYQKAAQAGDAWSMTQLGAFYESGQGMAQNLAEAKRWYEAAAKAGDPGAMRALGYMYARGNGVQSDPNTALRWFRAGADKGDPDCMFETAMAFMYGYGDQKPDVQQGLTWLQAAAKKNHAAAMSQLGDAYTNGNGVKQDYSTALGWYKAAADLGDRDGLFGLGWASYNGNGVAQNYPEAFRLFQLAAEKGHSMAANNIGYMFEQGQSVPVDFAKAMSWYRKAADAGNTLAMINIGGLYKNGAGVTRDINEARRWYQAAADHGNKTGLSELAKLDAENRPAPEVRKKDNTRNVQHSSNNEFENTDPTQQDDAWSNENRQTDRVQPQPSPDRSQQQMQEAARLLRDIWQRAQQRR